MGLFHSEWFERYFLASSWWVTRVPKSATSWAFKSCWIYCGIQFSSVAADLIPANVRCGLKGMRCQGRDIHTFGPNSFNTSSSWRALSGTGGDRVFIAESLVMAGCGDDLSGRLNGSKGSRVDLYLANTIPDVARNSTLSGILHLLAAAMACICWWVKTWTLLGGNGWPSDSVWEGACGCIICVSFVMKLGWAIETRPELLTTWPGSTTDGACDNDCLVSWGWICWTACVFVELDMAAETPFGCWTGFTPENPEPGIGTEDCAAGWDAMTIALGMTREIPFGNWDGFDPGLGIGIVIVGCAAFASPAACTCWEWTMMLSWECTDPISPSVNHPMRGLDSDPSGPWQQEKYFISFRTPAMHAKEQQKNTEWLTGLEASTILHSVQSHFPSGKRPWGAIPMHALWTDEGHPSQQSKSPSSSQMRHSSALYISSYSFSAGMFP